jgi:hypothetical protein
MAMKLFSPLLIIVIIAFSLMGLSLFLSKYKQRKKSNVEGIRCGACGCDTTHSSTCEYQFQEQKQGDGKNRI